MSSTHPISIRALGLVALATLLFGACAPAAAPEPAPATASPVPAATAPVVPSATPGARGVWTVGAASKATVRVREQLVGVSAPSDAVLVATGAKGAFTFRSDGTFTDESRISFDLSTLASDNRNRDDFVKRSTLGVQQFPTADFVPVKATGLTFPLPATEVTFKLAGKLTIHGVTKDVTFDLVAKRASSDLTATGTLNPPIKFGDFGMTAPVIAQRVVSVVDEIRMVIDLVATGPAN